MLENEKDDQISSVGQKWQDPFFDRRLWDSGHVTEPASRVKLPKLAVGGGELEILFAFISILVFLFWLIQSNFIRYYFIIGRS